MLAILMVILGIISRVVIHIPNFTPVVAITLFSGLYIKDKKLAVALPIVMLAIGDVFMGLHSTMLFTYGSLVLISLIGFWFKKDRRFASVMGAGILSSVIFFVITNLGVWMVGGLYPLTMQGLGECFVLAIPFFKSEFLSTLIYTALFYGVYEFVASRLKATRFASVL